MKHTWLAASLVFVGCQFQASCGGKTLSSENARKFVAENLAADVGAPPDKVECPEKIAVQKDATFTCTAQYGDATANVVIRQKDDQANVTIQEITGILVTRKAEEAIVKAIGEQAGVYVTVDCGPRARAAKEGDTFNCAGKTKDGQTLTVAVKVKDAAGNISFNVVNPSQ